MKEQMHVRRLRPDENAVLDSVQSTAFSFSCDIEKAAEGELDEEVYGTFLDDGKTLAATVITPEYDSWYCGKIYKSVGIGGVATLPEYRRLGCVRAIFDEIFRMAPERGWATSFLYPFSNDYYRQFGYELVLHKKSVKVPMSALRSFDKTTTVKLYMKDGKVNKSELVEMYNRFASSYNVMFRRDEHTGAYSDKPHASQNFTYLWYDGIHPEAHALVTLSCKNGLMTVRELCYDSPSSLRGVLGFLRMFEGQADEVLFEKLPADSELELVLSEYVDMEYHTESSAMGRVLLPQVLLENNRYPDEHGHFRLQVDDHLDFSRGVYEVEYGNGTAEVKKFPFDADYDISLTPPPLARILFGCGNFDCKRASYMKGVKLTNEAKDFFRAFPKRMIHLYEGF